MSTLTNKQRAKIYREAAELVAQNEYTGGCRAIISRCPDELWKDPRFYVGNTFTEFYLFKPDQLSGLYWWGFGDSTRVIALLFSEQIALNP